MNKNEQYQKGFTLIESLLVLSIFLILSMVTVVSLQPQHSVLQDEAFVTQLRADFLYSQQYAISHQDDVSVVLDTSQNKYYMIAKTERPPIVMREYSTHIHLIEGTMPLYFAFLADGNVNKFGSFLIQTEKKTYRVTFLIGEGRFYVKEQ